LPGQISHHQVERLEGLIINSFWRMFVRVFDDDDDDDDDEPLEYTTHELEL